MDDLAEFKQTYFQECEELLVDLEGQLTALQDGETDDEILHAAFRAIHSIKGGAGAFGFAQLVGFAHVFETVLDQMREHQLETSTANVALLIRAGDILSDLVSAAQQDETLADDFGQDLLESLHELAGTEAGGDDDDDDDDPFGDVNDGPAEEAEPSVSAAARDIKIAFAPTPQLFHRANDPLILIRELKKFGSLETEVDSTRLPTLEDIEADGAYLTWRFTLHTPASVDDIRDVFEFVIDDCQLEVEEIGADPSTDTDSEKAAPVQEPGAGAKSGERPEDKTDESEANTASAENDARTKPERKADKAPRPQTPAESPSGNKAAADKKPPASIRVDLDRIDRLVNMVGELVITQAMLSEQIGQLTVEDQAGLLHGVETLELQMRELQESVMSIRAQPVKSVFSRMTRLVRELSCSLDKKAKLVITGETTEVDKTVIEELSDPLTHMIRNSMDHGLETPSEREQAGKPAEGTIQLSAEHRNGKIVIAVSDDGRGINREKVLKKAIEKGLTTPDARPSDDEIDNMILLPGFSTADQVSNVSGRGVGMDVVVRKIQNMGGRIGITSVPGQSSRFSLTLPLTLAVLDGMIIRVGSEFYIIPITSIVETQRPDDETIHQLASGGEVLAIRGGFIKLVHLARLFGCQRPASEEDDQLVVVVETGASGPIGLVVDELVGQQQVVIKSLESNYRRVQGVAGATILGNGMVALILDVDGVHSMSQQGNGSMIATRPTEMIEMPQDAVA
ncbi:MAG: chemotaxis protein CheA [Pseudomonadota bacterium]